MDASRPRKLPSVRLPAHAPLEEKQVTHSDVLNWLDETGRKDERKLIDAINVLDAYGETEASAKLNDILNKWGQD